MRDTLQRSTQITHKTWLLLTFIIIIALISCTPAATPEAEDPTATVTVTRTVTQRPTPLPERTPTPTQLASLEINPDDLAEIVVRFAHPWVGEPAQVFERIALEFSLTNPWDIWVDVFSHGGQTALVDALKLNLDDDQMPGLIVAHPYQLSALGGSFEWVDLSEFYSDPEWGMDTDAQEDIQSVFMEPFIRGDQLIALPLAPQAMVLFYNQTWANDLGFNDPPGNLNTFRTQSCEATFANWQDDRKIDGTGGWMINLDPMAIASWYYAFDGVLPQVEVPYFNNENGRDAFGYLWDIKNQGCIWFAGQPDPYAYFADRNALMYAGWMDQIPIQTNWMTAADNQDEWVVIGFPGPAGETMLVDGPGLMVTAETKEEQLAAWLFAKHLLEPTVQAKLVQSLYSLPVRESAFDLLSDFEGDYPQWSQAAAMLDSAIALPVSDAWWGTQWILQDALFRILQAESDDIAVILEQLDEMIDDLAGVSP